MTIESVSRRSPKPGEGVATPRHGRQRQPTGRPQPQPGRGGPAVAEPRPAPQGAPAAPNGRSGLPGAVVPGSGAVPGPVAVPQAPRPQRPERTERPERPERSEQRGGADRSLYDGGSPSANRLGPAKAMRARDVSRG